MATVTQKRESLEFLEELRACDELISSGIKSLKTGNPLSAGQTAIKILGTSNRIKKAGEGLFSPHESPKENRELNDLLAVRQSDIVHLTDALKGGSEFLSFAVTFGRFIGKTDEEIIKLLGKDNPPERLPEMNYFGYPGFYPGEEVCR